MNNIKWCKIYLLYLSLSELRWTIQVVNAKDTNPTLNDIYDGITF